MTITRRGLFGTTAAAAGAVVLGKHVGTAVAAPTPATPPTAAAAAKVRAASRLVIPNGSILKPTRFDGATPVYHLIAQPIRHEIAPGLTIDTWGYNGTIPGPVIEAVEGERVRIYVTNKLPERTTVHWHGILLPNGMDGVGGLTQPAILPGKTFRYEFSWDRAGTFMYHPHSDEMTQIALGMMGMIVVHPKVEARPVDRDYALFSHEMKVPIGSLRPDAMAMNDFNVLTFNGKAFPATTPIVSQIGERVRIRLANLGPMDHHPIHIHGVTFEVVATDGGPVPPSARHPETTVLVPTGTTRTIEFTTDLPGDWPMHCHMTHHAMNQMGHEFANVIGADVKGLDAKLGRVVPGYMTMGDRGMGEMAEMQMEQPRNSISMVGGVGPHGIIDMGGMFTILKVRDKLPAGGGDPGWYQAPAGTIATEATPAELVRDGIPSPG